jgi:D-alanyl-D-alanine carboxypeptidase
MDPLEKLLLDEINKERSPSVQYILFNKETIIKRYAFGFADIKNKREVTPDTTYNAYSVTKTFTALAILQLAQKEKFDLGYPVKKLLPDIPYNSEITIRQILSHSSGIPNPIPLSWIHLSSDKTFDRNLFFKDIFSKNNKTKSGPNEKYAYSNLGYVILGQIIEKVSGISYEEYILNNILIPLGIQENKLGFEIHNYKTHSKGYHKRFSFFNLVLGFFLDKSKFMDKPELKWKPFKPFYVNGAPYGGLIGTADSFIKYIQNLLNRNSVLLSPEYMNMLFMENHTVNNMPTGMCLAWFKGELNGRTYYTHAGGGGGYYCEIRIYPGQGLGSVIFFNRTGMSDQRFLDRTDKIYFENSDRQKF